MIKQRVFDCSLCRVLSLNAISRLIVLPVICVVIILGGKNQKLKEFFVYLESVDVNGDEYQNIEIPIETSSNTTQAQSEPLSPINEVCILFFEKILFLFGLFN